MGSTTLGVQRSILQMGGLLPGNFSEVFPNLPRSFLRLLDNIWPFFAFLNSLHITVFTIYGLMTSKDSPFEEFMVKFQDLPGLFAVLLYYILFVSKRRAIIAVLSAIENDLPRTSLPGVVRVDMEKCVKSCRLFTKILVLLMVTGSVQHGLQHWLQGYAHQPFPFATNYPCAWAYRYPYYEILYFLQLVFAFNLGVTFGGFMAFFVSIARIATIQFEMLLCSVKNLGNSVFIERGDAQSMELLAKSVNRLKRVQKLKSEFFECREEIDDRFIKMVQVPTYNCKENDNEDADLFQSGEYDREALAAVIKCSQRHAKILRICTELEDTLHLNMMTSVGAITIGVCVLIFTITRIGEINQNTIDYSTYIFCGFVNLLILCYFPHLMSLQSGRVTAVIGETPWHLFGPKVRKHLLFFMLNSKNEFQFSCGKLIYIDLRLFIVVRKDGFTC